MEKRYNTITNNNIGQQNREVKRQNTLGGQGTTESKKLSSIIKNISSKRMSNQALGSNESLTKKLEA